MIPSKGILLGAPTTGATSAGAHQLESILRCEKEFQYSQVRKIREPQSITPDHFAVGLLFHAGRANWFASNFGTSKKVWDKIQTAIVAEGERQKLPINKTAELKARNLMQAYADHWLTRPLPKPVAAEYAIEAELAPGVVKTARLDDVSYYPEAGGALCLGESKTTGTDIGDTINQYTLHIQPMLQDAIWRAMGKDQIAGVMLDVVQKGYGNNKPKFARQLIPISALSREWFLRTVVHYTKRSKEIGWDTDVLRNISSCTRMVGRMRMACPYRDLCTHGKSVSVKYVLENGDSLLSKPGSWK